MGRRKKLGSSTLAAQGLSQVDMALCVYLDKASFPLHGGVVVTEDPDWHFRTPLRTTSVRQYQGLFIS